MSLPTPDTLTTLSNCKAILGIPGADDTQDQALSLLIPMASYLITQYCNRTHFLASNPANPVTEYYSGSGDEWLVLRQFPVQSITSIYADNGAFWGSGTNSFGTQTLLTPGSDYALELDSFAQESRRARVLRINGIWESFWNRDDLMLASYSTDGRGNLQVVSTVGYQTLPTDLSFAATMLVARMQKSAAFGGMNLTSESFEEYSYTLQAPFAVDSFGLGILQGTISEILAKYRISPSF